MTSTGGIANAIFRCRILERICSVHPCVLALRGGAGSDEEYSQLLSDVTALRDLDSVTSSAILSAEVPRLDETLPSLLHPLPPSQVSTRAPISHPDEDESRHHSGDVLSLHPSVPDLRAYQPVTVNLPDLVMNAPSETRSVLPSTPSHSVIASHISEPPLDLAALVATPGWLDGRILPLPPSTSEAATRKPKEHPNSNAANDDPAARLRLANLWIRVCNDAVAVTNAIFNDHSIKDQSIIEIANEMERVSESATTMAAAMNQTTMQPQAWETESQLMHAHHDANAYYASIALPRKSDSRRKQRGRSITIFEDDNDAAAATTTSAANANHASENTERTHIMTTRSSARRGALRPLSRNTRPAPAAAADDDASTPIRRQDQANSQKEEPEQKQGHAGEQSAAGPAIHTDLEIDNRHKNARAQAHFVEPDENPEFDFDTIPGRGMETSEEDEAL